MIPDGLNCDPSLLDPDGEPCTVSLVLVRDGLSIPMDDPAIQQARRRILAGPRFDGVSVLLSDDSAFRGSRARRPRTAGRRSFAEDPFAYIVPARIEAVGSGVFGRAAWPAGPGDRAIRLRAALACRPLLSDGSCLHQPADRRRGRLRGATGPGAVPAEVPVRRRRAAPRARARSGRARLGRGRRSGARPVGPRPGDPAVPRRPRDRVRPPARCRAARRGARLRRVLRGGAHGRLRP